jgi:hypothetical protein
MLSPYARPAFVDHYLYDHASILRFIEWRFLGAPAQGRGKSSGSWFLTKRDRCANNIGLSLLPENPDPEFEVGTPDSATSPACGAEMLAAARAAGPAPESDFVRGVELGFYDRMGYTIADWLP